ncbi:MAG: ParA family protein [Cocleimonas sp.]
MASHTKIIATAIEKGGVGKTSIAINLAYLLAEDTYPVKGKSLPRKSYSVTVMDSDPQGNATLTLLTRDKDIDLDLDPSQTTAAFYGWLENADGEVTLSNNTPDPIARPIEPVFGVYYTGLIKIIPSHPKALSDVEQLDPNDIYQVAERIRAYAEKCDSDVLIIDCSPQLGMRQLVAMLAADHIITPIKSDSYSEKGLSSFTETFIAIRQANENCQLHVIPNMIDLKSPENQKILDSMRSELGDAMTVNQIPYSNSINKAITSGRPPWRKPPSGNDASVGRQVRIALSEVLARCGLVAE